MKKGDVFSLLSSGCRRQCAAAPILTENGPRLSCYCGDCLEEYRVADSIDGLPVWFTCQQVDAGRLSLCGPTAATLNKTLSVYDRCNNVGQMEIGGRPTSEHRLMIDSPPLKLLPSTCSLTYLMLIDGPIRCNANELSTKRLFCVFVFVYSQIGLQVVGHRTPMFPDDHDALGDDSTGRVHGIFEKVRTRRWGVGSARQMCNAAS